MAKQNQAAETKSSKSAQVEPSVVEERSDDLADLALLPGSPVAASGSDGIDAQAAHLSDPRLQRAQQQALAAQIGRVGGNQHLQRVVAVLRQGERTGARQAGNGCVSRAPAAAARVSPARPQEQAATAAVAGEALEGLGAIGPPTAAPASEPPPNGSGPAPALQRQSSAGTAEAEAGPTEAEKAAALAAARAAQQAAAQAAAKGKGEVAQSKAKKAAAKQAGQAAKQKAGDAQAAPPAKTEAKAPAKTGKAKSAFKDMAQVVAPDAAKIPTNGKAPTSSDEDPAFQAVVGKAKGVAAQQQAHAPAKSKADQAQAAAVAPPGEVESKAQANQVGEMARAETPEFDAAAFKARLMERIEALAPRTAQEADEFKEEDKLGSVKGEMQGQVEQEREASQSPLEEAKDAPPDASGVEPKPVTPLAPEEPGPAPGGIDAQQAAPKSKGRGEVEAPLQERGRSLDQQMAEAEITEEQLAKSNEPEFQSALEAKKEAKADAQRAPQAYRQSEQEELQGAQAEAVAVAQERTQGMHGRRAAVLGQVQEQQGQAKGEDEQAREKVAADIQGIYEETKSKVEGILSDLDAEVTQVFDEGAAAAESAFEDYVDAKMEAFKQERYGGMLGWTAWLKDKVLGMPPEVNAFYTQGRQLYLKKMDAVIDSVVSIIGAKLAEAKAEVAQGKKRVQEYVAQLPEDLKQVGQQAAQDIQSRFEQLEQSVNAKQDELINTLANKYQEKLQALDARIEEMRAANQGLVQKALDAVGGVIKTILELKNMLLSVLARAADAVGKIIKDPIGFLGNLLAGVKQGFMNFVSNIGTHLKKGLMSWLFGEVSKAGIQLPRSFDLKGILSLVMQVLGLTWANIRARAVRILGERVVSALESTFEIFKIIIEQGLGGLWQYIKDKLGNLKTMVLDGIKDMVITQVIQAGVQWLMGILGGPAGAFIKAAKAIYDIVMWFVNNGRRLMGLVKAIIDSIASIAAGNVSAAARFIEESLARAIPVVIGFLASLLGLGGLAQKIQGIIRRIQAPVNKAIDWVLTKAKNFAKKIGGMLGRGKGRKEKKGKEETDPKRKAALDALDSKNKQNLVDDTISKDKAERVATEVKRAHPAFKSIKVTKIEGRWDYDYVFRARKKGGKSVKDQIEQVKTGIKRKLRSKYFRPGHYAVQSTSASDPHSVPASDQKKIDEIGEKYRCHHCNRKTPGQTQWTGDHMPVTGLVELVAEFPDLKPLMEEVGLATNLSGQRLYPHCTNCWHKQGGTVQSVRQKLEKLERLKGQLS